MFTQCRGCGEIFKVVVDDLVTASAMVRCSSCGAVFNSLDTLSAYKPQGGADLILHESDNPPPLLTHEFKQTVVNENSVTEPKIKLDDSSNNNENEDITISVMPDFVDDKKSDKPKKPVLIWVLFTLVMLSVLLFQASQALIRGSLILPEGDFKDIVCSSIDCFEPIENKKFGKITLVSRSIRQHPGRDNALIITTGIVNNNNVVYDFPALQVKMSNLNGETVAMRRFLPSEYVDEEVIAAGMLPDVLIPVTLELQSPGKSAVTFEVGFSSTYDRQ